MLYRISYVIICIIACNFIACNNVNGETRNKVESNNLDSTSVSIAPNTLTQAIDIDSTDFWDTSDNFKGWVFDSLVFDESVHIDNDTTKEGMNVRLFLKYPTHIPNNSTSLEKVQNTIAKCFDSQNKSENLNIRGAFNNMVEIYKKNALAQGKEYEDYEGMIAFSNYDDNINLDPFSIQGNLLTYLESTNSYYGGAHGVHYVTFYNIDINTGKRLDQKEIFKEDGESKLTGFIREEVLRRNSLSQDEPMYIYLLADISEVKVNDNFFFNKNHLVFVYNIYEITPYVFGAVDIAIPYNKIRPLIKDKYLSLFDSLNN